MKKTFLSLSLLYVLLPFCLQAQTGFDLWIVETSGKGRNLEIKSETAKALTDRPEYDNQPSFINEFQLVFSAADEKGNHDIIVYNFNSDKFTNLTKTSDKSEFSPSLTDCGQYVSAVVMEEDKKQRIWLYPTNFGEPELLYDDIEPVGYYDWYNNKGALFVLGEPNKLIYARGRDDLLEMDQNIARTVEKRPKTSEITYFSMDDPKKENDESALKFLSFDIDSGEKTELGYGLPGSQDLIWIDKKHILMARGNEIFLRNVKKDEWENIATLNSDTHQNISRMAYSNDLNVLVVAMERK